MGNSHVAADHNGIVSILCCFAGGIGEIARDCDVLIHEATNAFMPPFDTGDYLEVQKYTISHGHSTPQMAAAFARAIGAKKLVLTHFSPRYRGDQSPESLRVMARFEEQARQVCKLPEGKVIAAYDFMLLPVPIIKQLQSDDEMEIAERVASVAAGASSSSGAQLK